MEEFSNVFEFTCGFQGSLPQRGDRWRSTWRTSAMDVVGENSVRVIPFPWGVLCRVVAGGSVGRISFIVGGSLRGAVIGILG